MGKKTDSGHWNNPYGVMFPFTIDNRQYFLGQNQSTKYWFIQELLPNGKMGKETDSAHWNNPYGVMFPFTIDNRQYFLGQNQSTKYWFIQELLSNGKMGKKTDSAHWNNPYGVMFPFTMSGRQYFLGQNQSTKYWFIQELLPGGKMGEETDSGHWNNAYSSQFAFPSHGHLYFYGFNTSSKYWFMQELTADEDNNCKMGLEISNGHFNDNYEVNLPFVIDKIGYWYRCNTSDSHNWFIQELMSQDEYTIRKTPSDYTKGVPLYPVGWVPYLADWKNYLKKYNFFSALQYHDPSKLDGVGILTGAYNGRLYGTQMKAQLRSEELKPYSRADGHYSWALVPGGKIMYVWNSKLQLNDRNYTRHSDLNQGNPVVCAGEFMFSSSGSAITLNTIHVEINDASGHYKPDGEKCFSFVINAFKQLSIDTTKVEVYARKC